MTSKTTAAMTDATARIERILEAPRERVFRAWTEADQVAAWYGPAHAEIPRDGVRIDLRVGGRWEVTMVLPGGRSFLAGYEIETLVEPELIVMRSDAMPEAGMPDGSVVRIEFHDLGDRTRVTLTDGPFPPGAGEHAAAGYIAALDKLAAYLSA
jgi:uncharacterized protein YndB with AHSA1/START domain